MAKLVIFLALCILAVYAGKENATQYIEDGYLPTRNVARASSPISALNIVAQSKSGPPTDDGFTYLPTDLNSGAGGDYIYLGYQSGGSPALTGLRIDAYSSSQVNPPEGWSNSGTTTDCNKGAGGTFEYISYQLGVSGESSVTALFVGASRLSTPPDISGYSPVTYTVADLNKGSGGDYVYLYYSYTN